MLNDISIIDVSKSYLSAGRSRAFPTPKLFFTDKPWEAFVSLPVILMSLIPIFSTIIRLKNKLTRPLVSIFLISIAGIVTAIVGFVTNYELNIIGLTPILLCSCLPTLMIIHERQLDNNVDDRIILSCLVATFAVIIGLLLATAWIDYGWKFIKTQPIVSFFMGMWFASMSLSLFFLVMPLKYKWTGFKFLNRWSMTGVCYLILIVCTLTAPYMGGFRWRVMAIGPFFDNSHKLITIDSPRFFRNFYLSPSGIDVIQQIGLAIQHNPQIPSKKIFFGPRMEFAYAAFNITPPKGMPIWWHPGSSYPEEKTNEIVLLFKAYQFERCIFLRDGYSKKPDFTRLPDKIVNELNYSYNRTDYQDIVIYEKGD